MLGFGGPGRRWRVGGPATKSALDAAKMTTETKRYGDDVIHEKDPGT
jgi:hypothetical protein